MQTLTTIVTALGVEVFPLSLLLFVSWTQFGLRKAVLFLCSFTFQTNAIGWLYFVGWSSQPRGRTLWLALQAASVCYLTFVCAVWAIELGGKEDNFTEWIFNVLLHYVQPGLVVTHWTLTLIDTADAGVWPNPALLLIYPLLYAILLPFAGQVFGYSIYPVFDENYFLLGLAFACNIYLFHTLNNMGLVKWTKKTQ